MPAPKNAGVRHFIYIRVTRPAPLMKEHIAVRAEGERLIRGSGPSAAVLRPWHVLGPGHRRPLLILSGYWIRSVPPWTRGGARRLGLVKLRRMIAALVRAPERPAEGIRIVGAPEIKEA